MLTRILKSQTTTLILVSTLILITLYGYIVVQKQASAQQDDLIPAERIGDIPTLFYHIGYMVPENQMLIQNEDFHPQTLEHNLLAQEESLSLFTSSNWAQLYDMAISGRIKSVLVHHEAVEGVDQAQLRELFTSKNVTVGGIGIAGLELARMLGDPSMFTAVWSENEGYTTPNFYYIFSHSIGGNAQDIQRLKDAGWVIGEDPSEKYPSIVIESKLSISFSATTDSLLYENNILSLSSSLNSHISESSEAEMINLND